MGITAIEGQFELSIRGMHCVGCARGVQKLLTEQGAERVTVDFATGQASFTLAHPEAISKVIEAVGSAGYEVALSSIARPSGPFSDPIVIKFVMSAVCTAPLLLHMVSSFHALHHPLVQLSLTIPVVAIGLAHFGTSAMRSLRVREPNMDVLISLGMITSFLYSLIGVVARLGPDYLFFETSASIVCFALLGNLLEHRAIQKTTSAVEELARIQSGNARRVIANDPARRTEDVPISALTEGDLVIVNQGDKFPADGIVKEGTASVDESMLTGESVPKEKTAHEKVIGGTLVTAGTVYVLVTATGEHSVLAGIIRTVRAAYSSRPKIQRLADRVSAVFVPLILGLSIITFTINLLLVGTDLSNALLRAIAVLVVACPCAMGLATPTAVIVGIGRAARSGIIIKGGETLERLASVRAVLFDKTGTLTHSTPRIESIQVQPDFDREEVEGILVALEQRSSHPIAKTILATLAHRPPAQLQEIQEVPGRGMRALTESGKRVVLGSRELLLEEGVQLGDSLATLLLAKGGVIAAELSLAEEIAEGARTVMDDLAGAGIRLAVVSGDSANRTETVAKAVGIKEWYAHQTPDEKLSVISSIEGKTPTAYVGDGINDAPALSRASVGVSFSSGTDVALLSSHVALLRHDLKSIVTALRISHATLVTIRQNLFWAFFYNVVAIPFAAAGFLSPILASLAMAFSDVIVIGNSLRLRSRSLPSLPLKD